jgi:hypothetical protein
MEKYGTFGQATDDNIIRRMRLELCINKTVDTQNTLHLHVSAPIFHPQGVIITKVYKPLGVEMCRS